MSVRGEPRYFNEIIERAIDRATDIVDNALDIFLKYGHPPLTERVTLSSLKKMPEDQAVAVLRGELRRTAVKDELTGQVVPNKETIELITRYIADRRENGDIAGRNT